MVPGATARQTILPSEQTPNCLPSDEQDIAELVLEHALPDATGAEAEAPPEGATDPIAPEAEGAAIDPEAAGALAKPDGAAEPTGPEGAALAPPLGAATEPEGAATEPEVLQKVPELKKAPAVGYDYQFRGRF